MEHFCRKDTFLKPSNFFFAEKRESHEKMTLPEKVRMLIVKVIPKNMTADSTVAWPPPVVIGLKSNSTNLALHRSY